MSEEKVMNRWLVVVGAILIQLALGAIYAWSAFTYAITKSPYSFSADQTQLPFMIGLAVFAVLMVIAGRLIGKIGPFKLAFIGGILLGAGYILAGLIGGEGFDTGTNLALQILFIGVVGGAGIGLAYVVPIATGIKWFPDKKGLITGLAVAGFGFGALIWVKLAGGWPTIGLDGLVSADDPTSVQSTWLIYGIAFAAMVVLGSFFMKNPPEGWLPEGYTPPTATAATASSSSGEEFESSEMLSKPQFYIVFLVFTFSAMAGLMVIGIIKLFGIDALSTLDEFSIEEAGVVAGTAMAVFYSLFNGLGRIIWGTLSDKLGRRLSIILMTASQGIIMFLFYYMGFNEYLFYLAACIIGFNFGGNFALFPTITADFFGPKNVGKNYGWVFLAYGVAGLVGPYIAGYFKASAAETGEGVVAWLTPFIIAGSACILAAILMAITKAPSKAK